MENRGKFASLLTTIYANTKKRKIFSNYLCAMPRTKRPLLKTRCKTKLENHVNWFLKKNSVEG